MIISNKFLKLFQFMKKTKVLIVGSDGYLGCRITDYLISRKNYDCTGVDIGYFKNSVLYKKKEN